ncbi:hypothetical protein QSJ18_09085 [Gordonia sp. ABSL1-1]|uniref:hypothetical protein n=1 Tax=Gordonia sp. ABSL1-1 TaxID=3053923 RepID=UPI002572CD55|nr:hypothetical protein [Gordonia sp. ABSL1-1]MDL9936892.1 hypothetical protein [Gordonia sp. ABSL1-1]
MPAARSTRSGGRWKSRTAGAGLAGVAMVGVLGAVAPAASAGAQAAAPAAHHVVAQAVPQVAAPIAGVSLVPRESVASVRNLPGRHEVASPEAIGTSTAVGAGIGAVVGFGVGYLAAPLVGTIGSAVAGAASVALCTGATAVLPPAGVACTVVVPLAVAIAWPVSAIASPLIGAGIGAAIGAGVGAAVGSTYAADAVPAPKAAAADIAAPKPAGDLAEDIVEDPTVGNIITAADRALALHPELGPAGDIARQFLPKK